MPYTVPLSMTDDKNKNGTADRPRINIREPLEVSYWTIELGVSPATLKQLVRRYGVSAAKIRQTLGK
jgi:hypothetical protein